MHFKNFRADASQIKTLIRTEYNRQPSFNPEALSSQYLIKKSDIKSSTLSGFLLPPKTATRKGLQLSNEKNIGQSWILDDLNNINN